jgi:hypothetical protein
MVGVVIFRVIDALVGLFSGSLGGLILWAISARSASQWDRGVTGYVRQWRNALPLSQRVWYSPVVLRALPLCMGLFFLWFGIKMIVDPFHASTWSDFFRLTLR